MSDHLEKIAFELEADQWHGSSTETVWAEAVEGELYRVQNVPFYVFGIGLYDVVLARKDSSSALKFESVHSRSGHSTYRLIRLQDVSDSRFAIFWKGLQTLGCSYEGGPGQLLAVDVPPEADIERVYQLLLFGKQKRVWDFQEGHCAHVPADRDSMG